MKLKYKQKLIKYKDDDGNEIFDLGILSTDIKENNLKFELWLKNYNGLLSPKIVLKKHKEIFGDFKV